MLALALPITHSLVLALPSPLSLPSAFSPISPHIFSRPPFPFSFLLLPAHWHPAPLSHSCSNPSSFLHSFFLLPTYLHPTPLSFLLSLAHTHAAPLSHSPSPSLSSSLMGVILPHLGWIAHVVQLWHNEKTVWRVYMACSW